MATTSTVERAHRDRVGAVVGLYSYGTYLDGGPTEIGSVQLWAYIVMATTLTVERAHRDRVRAVMGLYSYGTYLDGGTEPTEIGSVCPIGSRTVVVPYLYRP